jgi:hypothetical protein
MNQMNDIIPELQQAAFSRYQAELNNQRTDLDTMLGMDQQSYGQYRDSYGDWSNNREYGYRKDQDAQQQGNWQAQFDYGVTQDAQQQSNWDKQFDYGVSQDKQNQKNWDKEFNYNAGQDRQAQCNYQNEFNYQQQQDRQNQANVDRQYNYNAEQDKLDRSDALKQYTEKIQQEQGETAAKESKNRISNYSGVVQDMLAQKDILGNPTYSPEQAIDYLIGLDLTDEELSIIINDNYDLRKYVENIG